MSEDSKRWINWDDLQDLSVDQIEEKAKQILSIMTLKEKLNQMVADQTVTEGGPKMHKRYNAESISAGEDKKLGVPGVLFSDGPRGVVIGSSTCFPVSMARGASWDLELEEKIGSVIGIEAKSHGANYFGGVCINLLRHPAWGRAQETYGEDTYHLGVFGVALLKGVQKHIMACAKHYACNSIETTRFNLNVSIDERTLREVYLPHFKKCVDAGVASIMSAYNKVNGKYCGHNPHLLREILKEDWNFKGFVLTDFFWGIRNGALAINAGVDIEMPFEFRMAPDKMIGYMNEGRFTEDLVDEGVLRILRQKLKFAHKGDPKLYNKEKIACKEHTDLALEAARKSIVLLKNKKSILPLKRNEIKQIAVFGKLTNTPNIGDHGSSRVYPPYVITPLEGIKSSAGNATNIIFNEGEDLEDAKELAKSSEISIIVAGYTHIDEGEGSGSKERTGDRKSLRLHEKDEKLISAIASVNENCIVALEGGGPIIVEPWENEVSAILMLWYPGMEGGTALGEILFGDINPSAKLPAVFAKSEDQLPYFDTNVTEIEYGYYHGYRLMDKEGYEPTYPFGYGLSYTSYSYNNLRIDKSMISSDGEIQVSVDVTNTGNITGEEVVQMYVGYKNSSVDRPFKDLKGFDKVFLTPGETKTVNLGLRAEDLAYYDIDRKEWVVENIIYIIYVGPSSRKEDLLTTTFSIS
ncbi:MAG: glycoside hydrolase family 3 C-terminal domain-containing protein [Candidatus Lokiarchaeota archaeon]|nr:glycoside hydrolase family 3 C-terminal domain-containing protein [Candidatus Lokiarchaeota archaeon]